MKVFCQASLQQDDIDRPNFSGGAYGPTNHITPSIKMSRRHKPLYLTAISTQMGIMDTLYNRVIDLLFNVDVIVFQSVPLYKQGLALEKNFSAL